MSSTMLQAIIWIAAGAALVMLMMRRRIVRCRGSWVGRRHFLPRERAIRADTVTVCPAVEGGSGG